MCLVAVRDVRKPANECSLLLMQAVISPSFKVVRELNRFAMPGKVNQMKRFSNLIMICTTGGLIRAKLEEGTLTLFNRTILRGTNVTAINQGKKKNLFMIALYDQNQI